MTPVRGLIRPNLRGCTAVAVIRHIEHLTHGLGPAIFFIYQHQHRGLWVKLKHRIITLILLACSPAQVNAESVWGTSRDLSLADGDGQICQMQTTWSDGRELSFWVNGHQYFGFSLIDEKWNLPQGLESFVTFSFGSGRENTFEIEAVSSTHAIGNWDTSDGTEFLRRLTEYWTMDISFPQGRSWSVDLTGSKAASYEWFTCASALWNSTGENPFGGETEENPF